MIDSVSSVGEWRRCSLIKKSLRINVMVCGLLMSIVGYRGYHNIIHYQYTTYLLVESCTILYLLVEIRVVCDIPRYGR